MIYQENPEISKYYSNEEGSVPFECKMRKKSHNFENFVVENNDLRKGSKKNLDAQNED